MGICSSGLLPIADEADDACCKTEEDICWRVDGVDKVDADERLL